MWINFELRGVVSKIAETESLENDVYDLHRISDIC